MGGWRRGKRGRRGRGGEGDAEVTGGGVSGLTEPVLDTMDAGRRRDRDRGDRDCGRDKNPTVKARSRPRREPTMQGRSMTGGGGR